MLTLNDFQRLLGDIFYLRATIGIKNNELNNLFKILDGDQDLNSPRELSSEAERELAFVGKKLENTYGDHVNLRLKLHSNHIALPTFPYRNFKAEG